MDKLRTGARSASNQLLKDVVRDYVYVEHMAMSISRKIIVGLKAHSGSEPEFIDQDEQQILKLYA